ncbi:MAG: protocatechuate 3,4-dioxygenase [Dehalococcoidia bacterium]
MAQIVLGLASSHAPQLEIPPDRWRAFGDRNRDQAEHWFAGNIYSFGELVELRASEHLDKECTEEKFEARFNACQQAIASLGQTLADARVDVCIVLGDDQMESFNEENMPAFCIYHGDTVLDTGTPGGFRGKFASDEYANRPSGPMDHPADAAFGEHLIASMVRSEFDVARSNKLPVGRGDGAIGHAFYYVYRRLMDNKVTPTIPVLVNTYFPPNAPTANRCYSFGKSLRQAIEEWDTDQRVAIFASGGLSHTVIEEELDEKIIDGLRHDDLAKLTDYPDERFRSGTSEIKNWIALAGAMSGTGLRMDLVDYVPCYRTEAGNGTAMGFAEWT